MDRAELSPVAREALQLMADAIRVGRLRRGWTVESLAERVGVSRPTMMKIERGDPGVAVGTVLDAAALVGVPLFDVDAPTRARHQAHLSRELSLLPAAARPRRTVSDDF